MALETEAPAVEEDCLGVLEFRLAHERYAVESGCVLEVHLLKNLTPLPCAPSFFAGIMNVRGRIVPVLDLKKFLDLPVTGLIDLHHVILVSNGDVEVGVLADAITGVREIQKRELQPSLPTLSASQTEHLKGVLAEGLTVLDLNRVLADPRLIVREEVET